MVEEKTKKKIFFFNGALGSGKTTLINQLIKQNMLGKFFIIENEIASLGIDNQCLHLDPKQIKTLAGECICCSDPAQLAQILKDLSKEDYENVVIESSGVTSMNQLLENILQDGELSQIYNIGACIFLVDALGLERTNLFDLEVSDFIIVTKYDALQVPRQFEKLERIIKQDYANINFIIKNNEEDIGWLQNLQNNPTKSFRNWSLRVGSAKYHGENFIKVLKGPSLEKFDTDKAFKLMVEKEIVRIKGFYKKGYITMHVEMTPEQNKVTVADKDILETGIVVIGQNNFLLDEFIKSIF